MGNVDLSNAPILDAHTHPYRLDELLARDPDGFDTRIMFLGEAFLSSSQLDPELWPFVHGMTDRTLPGIALIRWLAERLGCEATRVSVREARITALRADPVGYTKSLLESEHVVGVFSDEGYPQPPIPRADFEAAIGVPVHRVARLEPWILRHREGSFDELVQGVEQEALDAAADAHCVAF